MVNGYFQCHGGDPMSSCVDYAHICLQEEPDISSFSHSLLPYLVSHLHTRQGTVVQVGRVALGLETFLKLLRYIIAMPQPVSTPYSFEWPHAMHTRSDRPLMFFYSISERKPSDSGAGRTKRDNVVMVVQYTVHCSDSLCLQDRQQEQRSKRWTSRRRLSSKRGALV